MKRHCKKPCNECPFLKKSLPGWLGGFGILETYQAAVSETDFDCHKTRDKGGRKLCAGRLLFAAKSGKVFRNKELKEVSDLVAASNPTYKDEILSNKEFFTHHNQFSK